MVDRIVMVVDEIKNHKLAADITRNDLEGNSADQTFRLRRTLEKICPVVCYESVLEFSKHLQEHIQDIVFPMYYGPAGYNFKGIVPSLCETYGIHYVGADAYTQLLCNDKSLSKQYASNFGIRSPKSYILRLNIAKNVARAAIQDIELPIVVKPNVGGGSTGISAKNIIYNYNDAIELAFYLLNNLRVPILIEEYIDGYEVELITVGSPNNIVFCEEVQLLMGNKSYFDNDIWGFETKSIDDSSIDFTLSHYISPEDRHCLLNLFKSFYKLDIIRFDGRVKNGQFYLLELSPDCYLGEDCAFYYAFQQNGFSHDEMFRFIIKSSLAQS